jgi:hypothetical protein
LAWVGGKLNSGQKSGGRQKLAAIRRMCHKIRLVRRDLPNECRCLL